MSEKRFLTHNELETAARTVAEALLGVAHSRRVDKLYVYPVPRGGIPAFYLVQSMLRLIQPAQYLTLQTVESPEEADIILDDLVDSGKTSERMRHLAPRARFMALIYKTRDGASGYMHGEWLVFPWEHSEEKSIEDAFTRLIQYVGEDPARGGLLETPERMAKAWKFWTSGYDQDPVKILKLFEDGAEKCDEMVIEHNIDFYSQCEHHLAPFFGTLTFAYIPDKRVVGLSKMPRLVDVFARRLQVQERLTSQIVDAFVESVQPKGAAVLVSARHLCMESRGICRIGVVTTTSALRGVFKEATPRAEFLALATSQHKHP